MPRANGSVVNMSRAVVLGGGGPVGIGWEAGLAVGLAGEGLWFGGADLVVGTSAGSVVGAQLALGMDLAESVSLVGAPLTVPSDDGASAEGGMEVLMNAMAEAASGGAAPEQARIQLGKVALAAHTVDEDVFVSVFAAVQGHEWPDSYACTAIDVETGELRVWDKAAGVPMERAVASSCAVPGIFPPITIDGRRYMDGGMRTALNADVAVGHDAVIAVSCFILALPEGMSDPTFDAINAAIEAEFETLRASGATLQVVAPGEEFLEISGWGFNLMDPSRAAAAYDAGVRQAAVEAERLRAVWNI
jgi:NTE family protein